MTPRPGRSALAAASLFATFALTATPPALGAGATVRSESHVFEEIADGVYFATGTGAVNLVSNAMVVVNEDDVLVVDSHITADAARELIKSIAAVTSKPIRFLVNSHFHFDHAHGNQSFPDGVLTIGHEYTRERLSGDVLAEPSYRVIGGPEAEARQLRALEARLEAASDEAARSALGAQVAMLKRHLNALGEVTPTPPDTTLVRKLTLYRGSREIQIHHLGRGHTGGDVVVLLPRERVVFTGDLLYAGAAYLGDAYPDEFVDTLERLKGLDFDVVVPGHGPLLRGKAQIDFAQTYLRKYWEQVKGFHAAGLAVAEAIARLDLSGYEQYAAFQTSRPEVRDLEVRRMYQLLNERR